MKMAILLGRSNKVVVQGITGSQGTFHTRLMLDYGTKIRNGKPFRFVQGYNDRQKLLITFSL
jgi:succinyl-CoA synthetase alpha subunit